VRPSADAPDAACTAVARTSVAQLARLLHPGATLEVCARVSGVDGENLGASWPEAAAPALQHAGGEAGASGALATASHALGEADVASHAQRDPAPACAFSSLPHVLLLHVFAALPADARLRCAEVCRGWRSALAERSLWTRLNLSTSSGVAHRVTDALLRAAAAKAVGALAALDVSGCEQLTHEAMLAVFTANASSLRELDSHKCLFHGFLLHPAHIETLLRAAPRMHIMVADMYGVAFPEVLSCLRNEGVFAPLQLRRLEIDAEGEDDADVIEVAQSMSSHAFLEEFCIFDAVFEDVAALDALVDAALARRMRLAQFEQCRLSPVSVPSLVRLLGSSALKELRITDLMGAGQQLLDEPAAVLLASALQGNTTLVALQLKAVGLLANQGAAAVLLSALVAHPSLRDMALYEDSVDADEAASAGFMLSALLAANAPALRYVSVAKCGLGDAGLAPLARVLQRNTHLERLSCWGNGMSEAFAREQLLPAVRARSGLLLKMADRDAAWDVARDAEDDIAHDMCRLWMGDE
jgi:hypothetical protein